MEEREQYEEEIKENLQYDILKNDPHTDRIRLEEIIGIMLDVVSSKRATIRINGENMPTEIVRKRYLQLDATHIQYIFDVMKERSPDIRNIGLITDRNNLHDVDTWMFFKWIFKTACAVLIVTNTWNIVMGVFDAAQSVINNASGVVVGNVNIEIASHFADLEERLEAMGIGELIGLWLQSFIVGITMWFLTICIFVIAYGRMIEIYLVTSIAPIPMATIANREWGQIGNNYLRSLFDLGFQGFLIIVCVAIYAVLVENMIIDTDVSAAIWSCMGYRGTEESGALRVRYGYYPI